MTVETVPARPLTLLVRVWAWPSHEQNLIEYENAVLALLPRHGGRVVFRARPASSQDAAFEIQIIDMPDADALRAFMNDPDRLALDALRDAAVARSEVIEVIMVE